ncbi:origin recognition complex subunit 2-domain-containing protein [Trametes punicea]|nr:origin recognition complex subunit 2-domain-containing protein [Trametes punicea]
MHSEDAYTSYADDDEDIEDWPGDPRTPSRKFHRRALTDDDDIDEEGYADEAYGEDDEEPLQGFATHTAFDAYFQLASKPARTSSNVFSALLPPLTPEEFTSVLTAHRASERERRPRLWEDERVRLSTYRRFRTELEAGFNLLFYGCGSKRAFLNGFAAWLAEGAGMSWLRTASNLCSRFEICSGPSRRSQAYSGTSPSPPPPPEAGWTLKPRLPSTGPDNDKDDELPHLYIIVHNIEGAAFRTPKHRSSLALLALAPRIHLCASFDHVVGTPLRFSLSELFARKPPPPPRKPTASQDPTLHGLSAQASATSPAAAASERGFAWLWHDLTTLAPYDFELAYADPTVLTGASALRGARAPAATSSAAALGSAGVGAAAAAGAGLMTETAARHILASVTQKAKKLFVLLGTKQLEVMDAPATPAPPPEGGVEGEKEGAYDYDRLFAAARDNFVAQNDTALRALLGEFRDHGLVVSVPAAGGAGGEALWIPLRREALLKVVADLKAEAIDKRLPHDFFSTLRM